MGNQEDLKIYQYISDKISETLYKIGITKQPGIRDDHDGDEILSAYIMLQLEEPENLALKERDIVAFLLRMGKRAMGMGGYLVYCTDEFNKYICDFSKEEVKQIFDRVIERDPYDLLLDKMGLSRNSENEQCFDYIVRLGINTAYEKLGNDLFEPINLCMMMSILYYAGITIVLR